MTRSLIDKNVHGLVAGSNITAGEIDLHDGANGVIAGGVVELGQGIGGRFVLPAHVEQGDDGLAARLAATAVIATHQGEAARGEETGSATQGFQEVFAGDDGVVTAVSLHLFLQEAVVSGIGGDHLPRPGGEDAPQPIKPGLPFQFQFLQPQSVVGGARRAQVNGRGIARGAHGREDGLDVGALLVLHLVDDEQMVGRFAARSSLGMVGEESHGGVAQDTARRPRRFAPMVAVEGVVEPFLQALYPAAQAIARGCENHIASFALQEIEQINEQVGHGFVLATLAAKEEEVFTAVLVADAVDDGVERPELVFVKR